MAVLSAAFLFISGLLKFSLPGLRLHLIQPADGSGIIYLAAQALGSLKSSTKTKSVLSQVPEKKPETEQGILMIASGSIMFANKAFFKMTGYQPLDIFGKDFASLLRPDSILNYTMLSRIPAEQISSGR